MCRKRWTITVTYRENLEVQGHRGVELNVIKTWLGHVSITTTSQYIEIDMAMKREALERCALRNAQLLSPCPLSANGEQRQPLFALIGIDPPSRARAAPVILRQRRRTEMKR